MTRYLEEVFSGDGGGVVVRGGEGRKPTGVVGEEMVMVGYCNRLLYMICQMGEMKIAEEEMI